MTFLVSPEQDIVTHFYWDDYRVETLPEHVCNDVLGRFRWRTSSLSRHHHLLRRKHHHGRIILTTVGPKTSDRQEVTTMGEVEGVSADLVDHHRTAEAATSLRVAMLVGTHRHMHKHNVTQNRRLDLF